MPAAREPASPTFPAQQKQSKQEADDVVWVEESVNDTLRKPAEAATRKSKDQDDLFEELEKR